jgi:tRNA(adenine34) deaminase
MEQDLEYMRRAIKLALEAERAGNLPVGSVIVLDGDIVAEGKNAIWDPHVSPNRHAEIEALEALSLDLRTRGREMTLYSTLEPCPICLCAILVHRISRVVFGASDEWGGASCVIGRLPPAFERLLQDMEWVGPTMPEECGELNERLFAMLDEKNRIW